MVKMKKIWISLLFLSSMLFIILGIVKIVVDNAFLNGGQYIFTSVIYIVVISIIKKNRSALIFLDTRIKLGFIFSVIGMNNLIAPGFYIGLWALGIILMLSGIFFKMKNTGHQ